MNRLIECIPTITEMVRLYYLSVYDKDKALQADYGNRDNHDYDAPRAAQGVTLAQENRLITLP